MIGVRTNAPADEGARDYKCARCGQVFKKEDSVSIPLSGGMGGAYHANGCPVVTTTEPSTPKAAGALTVPVVGEEPKKASPRQNPGKFD